MSTERQALSKEVARFCGVRAPVGRLRGFRDAGDALGFDPVVWQEMAALGWAGVHAPEASGGAGLPFGDVCAVVESAARSLVPEPLLTSALAAVALRSVDTPAAHDALTALAERGRLTTVALFESGRGAARYEVDALDTRLEADGSGFRLTGEKSQVPHATAAERVVVPARGPDGAVVLALVPLDRPGVAVTRQVLLDLRPVGRVRFESVAVAPEELLATGPAAHLLLEEIAEHGRVALAAECLGLAQRAFELTLEWLKERQQFGVPIGSFQALQHRAAGLYVQLTLLRSAVEAAVSALEDPEGTQARTGHSPTRLVSLAKALACDTAEHVAREAIQMHGGIGMTDEHDIGWYLKRARVNAATLGDSAWHRARWARLGGYA